MTKPYLIVLDEPCSGMDPGARENFLATLQAVGKQKRIPSLIYVTHHVEEILPLFGKTLILKEGRVLYSGATRAVLKADVLRELYAMFRHNNHLFNIPYFIGNSDCPAIVGGNFFPLCTL